MATDAEVESVAADDAGEHQKLKKLGKYVIQRRLGAGGMGTVFLALDSELQRTVALKVLPRDRAANPKLVRRFKSEGQAAAKLEHDNIVKVYEAGEIDGFLYIALEYVDGTDVEDLIRKRTFLPVKRSIDIIRQVARALQHAHSKGIVHRDIKPSNLMIRKDGHVKLADMGLARAIDETTDTNITQPGMTVGTVDYMSPEQGRDSKLADIRSDIYSLGCTWYHMLTGSPPFTESSVTGKMGAHASKPPPNPRTVNENIPEAVVAVIHRMMAKEPKNRYQSPEELLADLNQTMLAHRGVESDVLAGLAASESNWELPVGQTADTREATTGRAGVSAKPKARSPRKSKPKRRTKGEKNGPPRSQRTASNASARANENKSHELPPRSENPEKLATSQRKLDLDRLKVLVIILIGVCVLGGVGWAVVRINSSTDDLGGGTLNPFQPEVEPGEYTAAESIRHQPPVRDDPTDETDRTDQVDVDVEPETPTAQLNQYQQAELFAGADRAEDVPEWLVEARAALSDDLVQVVVSTDDRVAADERSMAAALDRLPAAGGIIKLAGRGPFRLPPRSIRNVDNVAIRAQPGSQPVVALDATEPESLSFSGNALELSGIHLVVSGRDLAENVPALDMVSGTLLLRGCSVTILAPAPAPVTAIRLGSRDSTGVNCLLENTFLRGAQVTGIHVASTAVNVVAGNSLLLCGAAPAITVVPEHIPVRAAEDAKESITVALFATALTSSDSIFGIATGESERTPRVTLRARRTAFAAESAEAVWMQIANWPEEDDLSRGRVRGVRWEGAEYALLDWSAFVRFQSPLRDEPLLIRDGDAWRRFWSVPTDSRSFVTSGSAAPTVPPDLADPGDAVTRIETSLDTTSEAFGLKAGDLPRLPEHLIDRLRAESARPEVPSRFAVAGRQTVTFDLAQGARLNEFLNSAECPDGAIVRFTGTGSQIRPIELRNKSVRLVFPAGPDAVSLRPIQNTGGERPDAFIRVEGGSIDLVNAHLTIPSSARAAYPLRVLQVIDGSLTLDGCLLEGQFRDGAQEVSIVEWTRSKGDALQFARIRNSLISGKFQAVSAELSNRLLDCENTIFMSLGDTMDLSAESAPAFTGFSNCTFSTGNSAFRVRAGSGSSPAPITCFVERCVFAPSPETAAAGCVLLTHPAGDLARSVVWWGSHNGFAPSFRRFHQVAEGPTAAGQDVEADWVRLWGGDHVLHPLTGPTAVLLAGRLPEPDRVAPADFTLAETSEGRGWGPAGEQIGARVDEIGPNRPGPEDDAPASPRPRQPTPSNPGF